MNNSWRQRELVFLLLYAVIFYIIIIRDSLQLSHDHYNKLYGLRPGLISSRLNDASDAQWRNFRSNLPILTFVFGLLTLIANILRTCYNLKAEGMSVVWLLISLTYLSYLHGAFIFFILLITSANFLLVKIFGRTKYFSFVLWVFNLSFLLCNRVYEGYSFTSFGERWAYLDKFRGTFRWHICFNFVVLRMISFGYDYHWSDHNVHVDQEKHIQHCINCSSGKPCYRMLQERSVGSDKCSYTIYLCYLLYAPLYIAGPIISFNAFASQLDTPQKSYTLKQVSWYGFRWVLSLFLMEIMTHFFYYNAFAISGIWKQLSPMEVFIVGYGVLNFMWLKFFLIWRYFRFWALVSGIEAPENMPRCINNCYNLESFWKNWHASFNKWLVRYMYIPLGGSRRKLLNVWVVFTFVAIWHDLEWKLLSWAWLTCIFFIPEMIVKSAATSYQVDNVFKEFIFRELSAVAGAITITCLMVANLVGFVIGPSGISWLKSVFLQAEGLPTLFGLLVTFYVGTKLMFHVSDTKKRTHQS
ncbi:putative membrane-bound O-acyltransferase C24H6.01c [Cynara cardunculus var. scolymus]|uniref:putative membrane-bound O-acyltransferase C24H6.01c n=1 Tax=Cynara cardunculus var. scolymus TaxID=59895 RepID=UPI000D623F25|nr:putative membrane-bound O-acyltransferase C24H6.01c [Cynara cardunculus var. scolymus]XP_024962770.1 putative membrane-bound O-acyltransferase C24H6.01c [Cynara cardunculus var. scolymus]XP_024962772.1 putative membrane-bound O-acyltransferase C24H6.01c [Cynara cardunculus var. scolymus]